MTPTAPPEEPQLDAQPETPDYGENFRELPDQFVRLLTSSVKKFQKQDTYLRRREVMRDRRARFYERGYQHIYWNGGQGGNGGFALMVPGQTINGNQAPRFIDDYPIFWPTERIQLSILTQTTPTTSYDPDDPSKEEDVESAEAAETYATLFDRQNNPKEIQWQALRMMMLGGRAVTWTRTEVNPQRWSTEYGVETTTVYGSLETRVPIMAKSQEEALYCFLYSDPQTIKAKADCPWIRDKIKSNSCGPGENQYERLARLGALQGSKAYAGSGESFDYLCTEMQCFLRPAVFADDEYQVPCDDGSGKTCQEAMAELFPEGIRIRFMGETYAESFPESYDEHIKISFAYEGDGMFRLAPMDSMIVNQDAFNDAMNTMRLIFEVGWPSRWVGADAVEWDAIQKQVATPYALRLKKANAAMAMDTQFYQEEQPEAPPSFVEYIQYVQGSLTQYQTATPPSVWGAETPDNKTAAGQAQAKASALGQLGLLWQSTQHMWAAIRFQAAKCAAKNPAHPASIVLPSANGTGQLSFDVLRKGNFRCSPDEDSSMPESTGAKRDTLAAVMAQLVQAQSPLVMEIMNEPDNVAEYLRVNGVSEIVVPQAEARAVQRLVIESLLQQAPMRSPEALAAAKAEYDQMAMAQPPGTPIPPFNPLSVPPDQPSIMPNEWDYHEYYAAESMAFLNSMECKRELGKRTEELPQGNALGVLNVDLNRKAHLAMIPPPPMPMLAPPGAPHAGPPKAVPLPSGNAAPKPLPEAAPPGAPGAPTL